MRLTERFFRRPKLTAFIAVIAAIAIGGGAYAWIHRIAA
jgi:hypothetical protein